ncbi:MAG: winged helix-turn-helix domain-containing protein, partial [Pseudoxanthomonas sp.]
ESGDANAIEAIVARLRRKFGADLITTRRGFGYLLESEA